MRDNTIPVPEPESTPRLRLWQQRDAAAASPASLSLSQLIHQIQDELTRLRLPAASPQLLTAPRSVLADAPHAGTMPQPGLDWPRLSEDLHQVEKDARNVGVAPSHAGGNPIKRRIKSFLAKVVLGLSRFITTRQREFNVSTLTTLRDVVASLRRLEQAHCQIQQGIEHRLEQTDLVQHQVGRDFRQLRGQVLALERRLGLLLEPVRRSATAPQAMSDPSAADHEPEHLLDALRVAFEDENRGTREEVMEGLRVYVQVFRQAGLGTPDLPIFDLAAHRGEWLELLQQQGFCARGIESSLVCLEAGAHRRLPIAQGEPLSALRAMPEKILGGVTGFHVIDHLDLGSVIKILDETVRVLKPRGLLLLASANPENLLVASGRYGLSGVARLLAPTTLQFLFEQRGLMETGVIRSPARGRYAELQPFPTDHFLAARINPMIDLLRECLAAPESYAVIGRTAG